MATVVEFIQGKLLRFNFVADDAEIGDLLDQQGVNPADQSSSVPTAAKKRIIWELIPELLATPDITQGGYSEKRSADGIKTYYALLCSELGLENKLEPKREVIDQSNIW